MHVIEVPLAEGLRLAAALWLARGPHVERLVDVQSVDVQNAGAAAMRLLVERGQPTLAAVLAHGVALGEAVTILVPLAECIEEFTARDTAHGAVGVAAVAFDVRGAPVLGGFETVPDAPDRERSESVALDRDAYRALAGSVLKAVTTDPVATARLRDELDRANFGVRGSLVAFAERMLESATPVPVQLGGAAHPASVAAAALAQHLRPRTARNPRRVIATVAARFRAQATALRARLGSVRARFWLPAALGTLGLAVVALTLPADTSADPPTDPPTVTPSATPARVAEGRGVSADPVAAALELRRDATGARIIDDFGDVVLLELTTAMGRKHVLLERTDAGWRLREMLEETR